MPTIHRVRNVRVVIFSNDPEPAHVHLIGPDFEMRLLVGSWQLEPVRGRTGRIDDVLAWARANEGLLRAA